MNRLQISRGRRVQIRLVQINLLQLNLVRAAQRVRVRSKVRILSVPVLDNPRQGLRRLIRSPCRTRLRRAPLPRNS